MFIRFFFFIICLFYVVNEFIFFNFIFLFLEYGGIYFDIDEVILRLLDNLLNYIFILSYVVDNNLSNGLIFVFLNVIFIFYWLDGYRIYIKV